MKVLVSAYACEPNRGSEPGIGWKWVLELARLPGYDVTVITRSNNRQVIENFWGSHGPFPHLHFRYYDLPNVAIWLKRHGLPVNIYYALWLYGSGFYAERLHRECHFDMAHHLTFGVFRDAPCLYRLGIPVVIGPVGGGEYAPKQLMGVFPIGERVKEYVRLWLNHVALLNPLLRNAFDQASLILAKTTETKNALQKDRWQQKTIVSLETGVYQVAADKGEGTSGLFLFVGRFLEWKGIAIALEAFHMYASNHPHARLKLIGKGEGEHTIRAFIVKNKLEQQVEVIPWMPQAELMDYYQKAVALVFPSLHDSSGNVVLEAMAYGLPTICLDCGGPSTIMGNTLKPLIVSTQGADRKQIAEGVCRCMQRLEDDKEFYRDMVERSLSRARQFLWPDLVRRSYDLICKNLLS